MDLIQPLLSAALVVALLWATIRFLQGRWAGKLTVRRSRQWAAGAAGPAPLCQAGRLPLGPQHAVHLVRSGQRCFLLATHPSGVICISRWSEAEDTVTNREAELAPQFPTNQVEP